MTPAQARVLAMCEIRFYEASVAPTVFEAALRSLGWKGAPDFSKADLASLVRLGKGLRAKLRANAI